MEAFQGVQKKSFTDIKNDSLSSDYVICNFANLFMLKQQHYTLKKVEHFKMSSLK